MNWLMVFLGGGLGSVLRFGLSKWSSSWIEKFPIGTLLSNILASIILAIVVINVAKVDRENSMWYFFIAVGLCGGFSTFSTFSLETFTLFKLGHSGLAILNILLNLIICIGLVFFLQSKFSTT